MNNIYVVEDFLSDEEIKIVSKIIRENKWIFDNHYFSKKLKLNFEQFLNAENNDFPNISFQLWYMELIHFDIFSKTILKKIEKIFQKRFKVERVYANGQTFGQSGIYHQDSLDPNAFTFCLYLNNFEQEQKYIDDGQIMIKIPGEKHILAYEPIFNRGILFPSNFFHKGNAFSRFNVDIRISVSWKLTIIE